MIDKLILVAFHVCTHLLYVILTKSDKAPWICCKSIPLSGDSTFYSLQQRPPAMPPLRIILALIIQGTEDDCGNGPVKLDIATKHDISGMSLCPPVLTLPDYDYVSCCYRATRSEAPP